MQIKKSFFKDRTILITGGTGSFGKSCVKYLLKNFDLKKIIIFSRDELKQFEMAEELILYQKKLRFFIGDIRDLARLKFAMNKVDYVIHTAALKQVSTAEYNPFEVIKTNIVGTQNVIDAIHFSSVKKAIALSTDKAAAPINLYGASKLASDKIFIAANNYIFDKSFSVVRYGNVMMSRGSVIPVFLEQKNKKILTITNKDMTRFSITLSEGVEFVVNCLCNMWGGELFVPKIPSFKIMDLAKAISPDSKLKITGIRPGEKIHEEMITNSDSINTVEFSKYYVIMPSSNKYLKWTVQDFVKKFDLAQGRLCKKQFSYNSLNNKNFLNIKSIKKLLNKELSPK